VPDSVHQGSLGVQRRRLGTDVSRRRADVAGRREVLDGYFDVLVCLLCVSLELVSVVM